MLAKLWVKFAPFFDVNAWILILLCAGGVWVIDPAMSKTFMQFTLFAGFFVGIAIIASRHVLPQVDLTAHVKKALRDPVGAGLVVLGVCVFMSFLVLTLTLWGKG